MFKQYLPSSRLTRRDHASHFVRAGFWFLCGGGKEEAGTVFCLGWLCWRGRRAVLLRIVMTQLLFHRASSRQAGLQCSRSVAGDEHGCYAWEESLKRHLNTIISVFLCAGLPLCVLRSWLRIKNKCNPDQLQGEASLIKDKDMQTLAYHHQLCQRPLLALTWHRWSGEALRGDERGHSNLYLSLHTAWKSAIYIHFLSVLYHVTSPEAEMRRKI